MMKVAMPMEAVSLVALVIKAIVVEAAAVASTLMAMRCQFWLLQITRIAMEMKDVVGAP